MRVPWLMRKSAAVPFTWRRRAARTQLLTHTHTPTTPKQHTERLCLQRRPARVYRGGWRRCDSSASAPLHVRPKVALVKERWGHPSPLLARLRGLALHAFRAITHRFKGMGAAPAATLMRPDEQLPLPFEKIKIKNPEWVVKAISWE